MVDMRRFWRKRGTSFVVVLAVVMTGVFVYLGLADLESCIALPRSEIVRNYGLLIIAFWGGVLAVWRSQIASEQVKASTRDLNYERFHKGADMLGNRDSVARMGGIYTLEHLAKGRSGGYYRDQVIKLLAAFARYPVPDAEMEERIKEAKAQPGASGFEFREDVSEAVCAIGNLNSHKIPTRARPDISTSVLENMYFDGMDFSRASFWQTKLRKATLIGCDLTYAILMGCDLTDAEIINSDCTGSDFYYANFSGANFEGTKGLSQEQLDRACQKPGTPPPKNIPPDLNWDEEVAMERWRECYEKKP